ncbi:DUF5701 family protein [Bosea sp. BIWAKO-01]|uniref:DUF5701 family protein n=1 Tax=Bosea sp. BIWAKO-01 TaxID=506668 RepID=UPI000853C3BA|nr:DUF5701 family protein [Bosea sp. BIWAKO-01]GAU86303.1 hypothetical protein BIWAKO_06251 [Bosea sp. BIWAKO-01]
MLNHFDRQAEWLLKVGYPEMMGISDGQFCAKLAPLRSRLTLAEPVERRGNIPLCIAFREGVVGIADAMSRIQARSANGIVDMTPLSPADFHVLYELEIPTGEFYLLLDVDTGRDSLNVSPENALAAIRGQGRTPLTLAEGVALTAQVPELLTNGKDYNCIQMPGSRKPSDQRVPSIWFSKGAPRLGWCWDRNIHTWLGSASAACRLGATSPTMGGPPAMPA